MGRDAKALSTIEYVRDSRFEVVSCCFTLIHQPFEDYDQATQFHAGEGAVASHLKYIQGRWGQNLEKLTVVCHNATFDATVLSRKYGIHPPHIIDTLGLARHQNSRQKNDLGTLCKQYSLKEKGDTSQFHGVTFRNRFKRPSKRGKGPKLPVQVPKITDAQLAALSEYNCNDNMREWELFTILLPLLSNPKTELRLMQHSIELFTKPVLKVDFALGKELIGLYEAEMEKALAPVGATRVDISGDLSFAKLLDAALEAAGDHPQKYYKVGKRGYLLAIAKPDPERQLLLDHPAAPVRNLMSARIALDSWPLHIGRVKRIMAQATADLWLLPVPLRYHGAHTGRWSGGEGINLQNLSSRGTDLVNAIRHVLIAPPDHTLVIVDAAAIEARVLAWIAGQWDLVEKFKNGEEIYCGFASKVLGYHVRKPQKLGGIPAIEQRLGWARNAVGKIGILGCGYGMGAAKTESYAKGAIDFATAQKIVQVYREENKEIVAFWKNIERAFIYAAKYQQACELPRGLRFDATEACDIVLTLSNGRELHYPRVKVVADKYGDKIEVYNQMEHCWEHTWGGSLTENVVQAMSRDILAEALLRLEDQGHHIAFHVHDELVLCVPDDKAEAVLALAIKELSVTPTWAPLCPLAAEGGLSKRYGAH
jgi:DNA polymerase